MVRQATPVQWGGNVRHIYFIAETKGSMSSLKLREIETARINCANKFFAKITSNEVKYDVVRLR